MDAAQREPKTEIETFGAVERLQLTQSLRGVRATPVDR